LDLFTIIDPETHLFSEASLIVETMIAQRFLLRQLFPEVGHTAPSENKHLIDFQSMNSIPAPNVVLLERSMVEAP
jgi:hypothetical protein